MSEEAVVSNVKLSKAQKETLLRIESFGSCYKRQKKQVAAPRREDRAIDLLPGIHSRVAKILTGLGFIVQEGKYFLLTELGRSALVEIKEKENAIESNQTQSE